MPQEDSGKILIQQRESWSTKIGVILAVAGSAVGLGNFLRFPGIAVQNGGGAFMIPYFLAFILLGVPICWAEWIMGRRAGRLSGLSSAPGLFGVLTKGGPLRYFGALGLFIPVVIYTYYVYVESWCLAYTWFSLSGALQLEGQDSYANFFAQYTGDGKGEFFNTIHISFGFFLATFAANFYLIYRGLSKGIERFCRIAMPALIIMAFFIVIRVITLGTPDPSHPEQNLINGLGYMWNPDWSQLQRPEVWINACGQIFFSLSVGFGIIVTYASYLNKKDDVVLSGLSASSTNLFCEVCLGGLIIIPAALIFLGITQMESVAEAGTFGLGFVVMPRIFEMMPLGQLVATCFYFLLFLAGITSSLSMLQPAIAFFEEGFGLNRKQSVALLGVLTFTGACAIIFSPGLTAMDTVDSYTSNIGIPLLALFEVFIFIFILKVHKGFKEADYGADMRIPRFFGFIITYITPLFLFAILGWWFFVQFKMWLNPEGMLGGLLIQIAPGFHAFLVQTLNPDWTEWSAITNIQLQSLIYMVIFFFVLVLLQYVAWPRMKRHYHAYRKALPPEETD
ncbi:sodium:calcium symporter [bacterium]|nr:sodium:calcium symporter [bacterium]